MPGTTGQYATQHAGASGTVARKGAPVTFTRTTRGAYDETTDTPGTPTVTTIPGSAVQVRGSPNTYLRLTLIESSNPTLFFTPSTYGDLPKMGDTVTWAGAPCTVADVNPVAPDGVVIAARIVVSR